MLLLSAILVTTSALAFRPNPAITGMGMTLVGVDSTVKVGSRIVVSGLIAGDTIAYTYYSNDTLKATRHKVAFSDSLYLPAPAYGKSSTYKGCIQVEIGGRTSGNKFPTNPLCWSWLYTRGHPMLTIDSVSRITLRFEKAIVNPNEVTQICAFGEMLDGTKFEFRNSWNIQLCADMYAGWLAERGA